MPYKAHGSRTSIVPLSVVLCGSRYAVQVAIKGAFGAVRFCQRFHDKGKPSARMGRKAMGPWPQDRQATERKWSTSPQAIVNMFQRWYRHLGFVGCSSHSGRRTFITNAARKISTVGGSLKDVQELAGHANIRTTQRYIDANPAAQTRVVAMV